ncbi:hypothetical protein PLESTB_000383100 [Pleodorina starrii]|uniref:Uncharacterized protein n=1 Tax=Pleodorina starrii TaxID=330485 RepID=A0A9W6EYY1_9CHLO|nr:hypothetical protein PLESTB_000383100 [Pleodorina starrii]
MSIHAPEVPVRSTLKARHLQRLSHLCSDSAQVLLQMGDEAPLSVTFELRGGGTCQIFIAPCLEDDQDDELLHSGCERGAKRKAAGGAGEVAAATKAKGGVSRPGKCGKAGLAGCDGVDGDDGDSWQRGGGASSYGGATTVPYGGVSGDAAWDNGGVRNADDEDEDA